MSLDESRQYELIDRLAEEFAARYRRGENPLLQEYIDRYPDLADDIRELLPALAEVEQVKEDLGAATGGAPVEAAPAIRQIGDFRIIREVGKGGMGIVYEAEQLSLSRRVALKLLPKTMLLDARAKQRFAREAKTAAKLHHTNIVPVFAIGEHEDVPYFVMQFIQGLGLDSVLTELRRLPRSNLGHGSGAPIDAVNNPHGTGLAQSLHTGVFSPTQDFANGANQPDGGGPVATTPPQFATSASESTAKLPFPGQSGTSSGSRKQTYWHSVARIGVQVAQALEYAHQQGVVHRDIKPSNLLLDGDGTVWVTDFGLAKADDQQNLTQTGDLLGTLRYMPPEAFEGKLDVRSDTYSLGLTLYELLALRPAFDEPDRARLVKQVTSTEPPRLDKINAAIPRDLVTIVQKSIEKEPAARYATAAALAADLQRFLDDEPIKARRVSGLERLGRWSRRNKGLAASLAFLALVLVIAAVGSGIAAFRFQQLAQQAERAGDEARARGLAESWTSYRANLAAAASALELNNTGLARRVLEAASPEYRNWEWLHLFNQLDVARLVIPAPAPLDKAALAFSRDGTMIATGHAGGLICLWDAATGKKLASCHHGTRDIHNVAFSPDSRRLVSGSFLGHSVCAWDLTGIHAGHIKKSAEHEIGQAGIIRDAFSPDRTRFAACLRDNTAGVWDTTTGAPLADLPGPLNEQIGAVAVGPDGQHVAYTLHDRAIRIWDIAARKETRLLHGHSAPAISLAFSPDGERLVSGAYFPDNSARLWDLRSGEPIAVLRGHKNQIHAVAFSPDGSRVATASLDQTARLWNGRTGEPIATCSGHTGYVHKVAFSPDGKYLVTSSEDHTLRLWYAAGGELVRVFRGHKGAVENVAFSPDGARLVSSANDQSLRIWDMSLATHSGVFRGHESFVYDATFTPDGARLASVAWDGTARLWDIDTGKASDVWFQSPRSEKRLAGFPAEDLLNSISFSTDGKQAAVVARSNGVHVWNVVDGTKAGTLRFPPSAWDLDARAVFQPHGTLLAAGCTDDRILLWDVTKREAAGELSGKQGGVSDVAFSPDGLELASAGRDGTVHLWDVRSRKPAGILSGHTNRLVRLAYSSDGRLLASTSHDKTLRVWDVKNRLPLASVELGSVAYGLAFSPDGTRLAAGCGDNGIRLWDLTWTVAADLQSAVARSADSTSAATAGLRVTEVVELRGHKDYVHAVAFSPDGTRLVSGSGDRTVRIWDSVPVHVRARPKDAYIPPRHYVCHRATGPVHIDGRLDEDAWQTVPWTEDFVDIEGDLRITPRYRTRAKMMWDDRYFYVAAELREPHVWGTLTKHDSVIFQDNDFEVFIDPDGDNHNYGEFEINALNTGWDLRLTKPYRDKGKADDNWEIPGLRTAVHIDGTLNDPRDLDKGWSVEIAFPWEVLGKLSSQPAPPRDGDQWRVNFSRVEWRHEIVNGKYRKVPHRREDNWVWSPQWAVNMHMPENWGYVQFSTAAPGRAVFRSDSAGPAKHLLHRLYYAQARFHEEHKRYAATLDELGLTGPKHETLAGPVVMEPTAAGFRASVGVRTNDGQREVWSIQQDSLLQRLPKLP